ncbi:MAG: PIG-L deacetylase family protein [Thermodesulfobacteriota bacterium]
MLDLEFQRAMVIIAHPDDAEVQCAGTIALWVEAGRKVTYVVLTRGDKGTQDPSMIAEALARLRREEQLRAAEELGVGKVLFLENGDGELEVTMERRRALTRIIREYQPEVLVTHDPWMRYQLHPDHRASGTLALDAMISARDRLYFPEQIDQGLNPCRVRRALLFASDQPDFWVDIEQTLDKKIKALGQHQSQVSQWPRWEEWLRKRAENAGASQGLKFAEPFKRLVLS